MTLPLLDGPSVELVVAINRYVEARVREAVAVAVTATPTVAGVYTDAPGGPLPDGVSARTLRRYAPHIADAYRVGVRHWAVPRPAWHADMAARAQAGARRRRRTRPAVAAPSGVSDAARAMVRGAGLRPTVPDAPGPTTTRRAAIRG